MNLVRWLDSLAAVFRHKLLPLEAKEYVDELNSWKISDDDWIEIKQTARRRLTFFPSLLELEEIRNEVKRTSSTKNSLPWIGTFVGEDGVVYAKRKNE